jgi:hypothetical protein
MQVSLLAVLCGCGSRTSLTGFDGPGASAGSQPGSGGLVGAGGFGPSGGAPGSGGNAGSSGAGGSDTAGSCPPGTIDHDGDAASACLPCPPGTFANSTASACNPWSECSWDFPETTPPSSSSDRVCSGPQPFRQIGTDQDEEAYDVVVDGFGNVYVSGGTAGALDGPASGNRDAFVRKYSALGALIWTYQGSPAGDDTPHGLALDSASHLHVLVSRDEETALLMFDLDGTLLAEQILAGSYTALAVDAQGIRYVSRPYFLSDGSYDFELTRLDFDGSAMWTIIENGGPHDMPTALAALPNGDVVIAGSTDGGLFSFGTGRTEAFVARYDASANFVWGVQFATAYEWTSASSVASDSGQNVYVAGDTSVDDHYAIAGFIARVSSSGQLEWATTHTTYTYDYFRSVAVDAYDQVAVTGSTWGLLGSSDAGGTDAFVARILSDGELGPVVQFGTLGGDNAYDLAASRDGAWFVVGATQGSFGAKTAGGYDAYLLRVEPF